jgi:hypothetical protein
MNEAGKTVYSFHLPLIASRRWWSGSPFTATVADALCSV